MLLKIFMPGERFFSFQNCFISFSVIQILGVNKMETKGEIDTSENSLMDLVDNPEVMEAALDELLREYSRRNAEVIDETYEPSKRIPGTPLDPTPRYNYLCGSDPILSSTSEDIWDMLGSDLRDSSIQEEPFDPEPCDYDAYRTNTTDEMDIERNSRWRQLMPEDEEPEKKEEVVSVNTESVLENIISDDSYQRPAESPELVNETSTRNRPMRSCRQKKAEPVSIQNAVQSYFKARPESARKRKRVANSVATSFGSGSGSESDASPLPPAKRAKRAPGKAAAKSARSEQQRLAHSLNEKMRRDQQTQQIDEVRSLVPIDFFQDRPNARAKASKEKVVIAATACLNKLGKLKEEGQTLDSLLESNADLEKENKRKIRKFLSAIRNNNKENVENK